jgi:predicted RNase H-like HicB family nuclease
MLTNYIKSAMKRAKYEILEDDGSYYVEIPELEGVYANEKNLESCRTALEEILEEWIFLRVSKNFSIPVIDGIELKIGVVK